MPSIHLGAITFVLLIVLTAACAGETLSPIPEHSEAIRPDLSRKQEELPLWHYVNSGWVSPLDQRSTNAFSRELRADVITNASELESFYRTVISKRTQGTGVSLNRANFPGAVVLVAYVMWLPLQGDPLSVVDIEIDGWKVVVYLELDEESQGREYPYLFAPMTMVAVDRSKFPVDGLVSFDFRLDDELQLTVEHDLQ